MGLQEAWAEKEEAYPIAIHLLTSLVLSPLLGWSAYNSSYLFALNHPTQQSSIMGFQVIDARITGPLSHWLSSDNTHKFANMAYLHGKPLKLRGSSCLICLTGHKNMFFSKTELCRTQQRKEQPFCSLRIPWHSTDLFLFLWSCPNFSTNQKCSLLLLTWRACSWKCQNTEPLQASVKEETSCKDCIFTGLPILAWENPVDWLVESGERGV